MSRISLFFHVLLNFLCTRQSLAWVLQGLSVRPRQSAPPSLRMGLLDFFQQRRNDFIKMEQSQDEYGPGPLLVLYNCPSGVDDEEVRDIIHDGAPVAHRRSCRLHRIQSPAQPELDLSVRDALERIVAGTAANDPGPGEATIQSDIPVLLFSGFRRQEMMAVYNILSQEISAETGGAARPACAMVVPNAMGKPLRQVFEEISGDHADATGRGAGDD